MMRQFEPQLEPGAFDNQPRAREKEEPGLFKFRAFDPELDPNPDAQGYAASLLRDGLIYCASPHEFDDPWEGRPAFAFPDPSTDPGGARRFVEALASEEMPAEQVQGLVDQFGYDNAAIQMQDIHYQNNRDYGVFSMAGNATEPLLWSHYAGGHKGFCWVFNNRAQPFSAARRVDYAPDLDCPHIEWGSQSMRQQAERFSFFVKAPFWKHQDEYRLIVTRPAAPGATKVFKYVPHNGKVGRKPLGYYLEVDRGAIAGVIFAAQVEQNTVEQIVRMGDTYWPKLKYYKAQIHRRRYEMHISPIPDQELRILRLAK